MCLKMLRKLIQELNEVLGVVEVLTTENETMENEIKVKEKQSNRVRRFSCRVMVDK